MARFVSYRLPGPVQSARSVNLEIKPSAVFQRDEDKDPERGIHFIANQLITAVLSKATKKLRSRIKNESSDEDAPKEKAASIIHPMWQFNIKEFTLSWGMDQIRNYVLQWRLSKEFKFCIKQVASEIDRVPTSVNVFDASSGIPYKNAVPDSSSKHRMDVLFSKPTKDNPNPLAVAKVHFVLYAVSIKSRNTSSSKFDLTKKPKKTLIDMPCTLVRIRYQFEGFNSWHLITSNHFDFQDAFIRFILNSKEKFYAENKI